MYYRINISLLFLIISIIGYGQSQIVNSGVRANLIKNQLFKGDLKKIIALEKDESEAQNLMQISDKNYEELGKISQQVELEKNKKKLEKLLKKSSKFETIAIKKRIESLKLYHEVFVQRYKIYKTDLKKFFSISDPIKIDSASVLEKQAYDAFEKADFDIERVYYTINPTDLFKIFTRAYQSEQLGLLYQEKMYSIFLDWDADVKKSLDEEIIAFQHNEPVKQYQSDEVKLSVKDSINIKTVIVYDTVKVAKNEDVVIYRVQIAASKTEISADKLNKIYPSLQLINSELDNGWHKYTVGYFTHYQDAQRFKINTGVPDAFIVAYKNGKRTPIIELVNHISYIQK
jgi:hypothetical protein